MAYNESTFSYSISGTHFTVPVLLQILSGARSAQQLLPPGSVYTLPRNKPVEVSIAGGDYDSPVRNNSPLFVQVAY